MSYVPLESEVSLKKFPCEPRPAIAKCWNMSETAPIVPFPGITSLVAQRAVMLTTTNWVNCEVFAWMHHACMHAPLHTLHFFFLSWSAMLIPPLYLKGISINLDVGMFAAKFGVDRMLGC